MEQEKFDKIVADLVEENDLDGMADKILVERLAMYLIRIVRAEAYEATVGLNEKTAYWDSYIGKMDSTLRGVLKDLAINRGSRMKMEKGEELLFSLDKIMRKFASSETKSHKHLDQGIKMRRRDPSSVRCQLLDMWEKDFAVLMSIMKSGKKVG